ncbi:ABC transporter permease [Sciscionella marina]|uniref:ABC transporter permease n=1 Tax=Sciscionella marina TaxID=508770 RepID=UPI00039E92DC|nr:ABC transporter permease [Sciscionella marina]
MRRFLGNRMAVAAAVLLAVLVLAAVFAGPLSGYAPTDIDLDLVRSGPSARHWLGTDSLGRDELSRLLYAGRVSLGVGGSAALIGVLLGTLIGGIAGLFGRWIDQILMRGADVFLSFPSLVVMIVLAGIIGPSVTTMTLAIGIFQFPTIARLVRGLTLSLRELEYVRAARASGAGSGWIFLRHVLPAVLPSVSVAGTVALAQAIALEATMSFLGVGVQPPAASWGNMLTDAQSLTVITKLPWLWAAPGVAIALTVLAVNFLGDGLRDALEPRSQVDRVR